MHNESNTRTVDAPFARLEALERDGLNPFPYRFQRTHSAAQLQREFAAVGSTPAEAIVAVMGRVMAIRDHGRSAFLDVLDFSGRVQVYADARHAPEAHRVVDRFLSAGDIVGVRGRVFRTRSGELSVEAAELEIVSKCLTSLPDKVHGVTDQEILRAQRHIQLLVDPDARERVRRRARVLWLIREFLNAHGFVEVETPVLQPQYGGAEARPFVTHVAAFDQTMYLRIAPELYLKRLIIGGMGRVYEIGRNYRNEGLSSRHHPEFTALELYQEGADYTDMMAICERLINHVTIHVCGATRVTSHMGSDPVEVELTPPFRRLTVLDGIRDVTGLDFSTTEDGEARRLARQVGVEVGETATADDAMLSVFEACVEPTLVQPTFVMDYPASLCPLTKRHRREPRLAERFELYIGGLEFANAYSELTDPREQRRQFEAQVARRLQGDELSHPPDWDFVSALEWGMPPTGGLGIGLDRLVMLLTGARHIQDVILFPLRARRQEAGRE